MSYIKCNCGNFIQDDVMEFYNQCNEEGEEYGTVEIYCENCSSDHEASQWGHFEDQKEAMDYLQEYIDLQVI